MGMKILLLGAGFSANWGAPVASKMFNWLLARPEISGDQQLKQSLWDHQRAGGFENALAQIQSDFLMSPTPERRDRLDRFQAAIEAVFEIMERGFSGHASWEFLEPMEDRGRSLEYFLVQFDAIFTLNQDLLFERFYLNPPQRIASGTRWNMAAIRGMRERRDFSGPYEPARSRWVPLPDEFNVPPRVQPYYKLHGSYRWNDGTGNRLIVMGGSKSLTIQSHAVLKWYLSEFERHLNAGATLMVIGYGFNDPHINDILLAAGSRGLKMFIIDLLGAEVSNPDRSLSMKRVNPFRDIICGVSQEELTETFGRNAVEHEMVMNFFRL
jgi:hypothetical protein